MSVVRSIARGVLIRAGFHEKDLQKKLLRSGNRMVFLFHRVLPAERGNDLSPAGMVVTVDSFRRFLDWLPGRFDVPPPGRFLEKWPAPADRPEALITFDDGWLDVAEHALPELASRDLPAHCFVTPRFIDEGGLFWPERLIHHATRTDAAVFRAVTGHAPPPPENADKVEALLTAWKGIPDEEREEMLASLARKGAGEPEGRRIAGWDELRRLREGGVEIGSHGMSHRLLTGIPEEEALEELVESRRRIGEKLGTATRLLAYPNGDRNAEVRRLARRAGYDFAFSLRGDWADRYDIPRTNLHEGMMAGADRLVWALGRGR